MFGCTVNVGKLLLLNSPCQRSLNALRSDALNNMNDGANVCADAQKQFMDTYIISAGFLRAMHQRV